MDPVIDAFTRSNRPARSATIAMISSAAFPNVAFSSPPTPSPSRSASCSVARPMRAASGMIAADEARKMASGLAWNTYSISSATGKNTSSRRSQFFLKNSDVMESRYRARLHDDVRHVPLLQQLVERRELLREQRKIGRAHV